jgi:hypothetical protein
MQSAPLASVWRDVYVSHVTMTGLVPDRRDLSSPRPSPLRRLTASLLILVQLVVALSPIIDGRLGQGAGMHVESTGLTRHYAHEEATCPTCAAQSIHAPAIVPPRLPRPLQTEAPVTRARNDLAPSVDLHPGHLSRAPPASLS